MVPWYHQASRPEEEWIGALQKCRQARDRPQAKRLHSVLRQQGLDAHPVLGNHVVPMLVDCGSLPDAQQAFDRLAPHERNIHSWTSLINGYIGSGHPRHALTLYHTMQEAPHFASPNVFTYLALLDAVPDLDAGRGIHAGILKRGFDLTLMRGEAIISNTLVDMYCKCGFVTEAQHVFDRLPARDAVSWNALIAGYAQTGLIDKLKNCIGSMQLEGLSPDSVTFLGSLKACGTLEVLGLGQELHTEVVKRGLENQLNLGSALVDMYIKCGLLAEGHHVFHSLPARDAVSWNALITGSIQYGCHEDVLTYFKQMQQEGMLPDDVTFISAVKACSASRALEIGQRVHSEIVARGLEREVYLGNTLVGMYNRCGSFMEACHVFFRLPARDVASWNVVIGGFSECELHEKVRNCLQKMQYEGISPDPITYSCSLKACRTLGALGMGQEIHVETTIRGLESELFVGSTLVDMYTKCGLLADAQKVFDGLPSQDIVTWNILISGYSEHGLHEKVVDRFVQMRFEGVRADAVTFVLCVKACGALGALEIGHEVHAEIRRSGLERDPLVACMLIDMYGKFGMVREAHDVFDWVPLRDTVLWNTLIKAYGENHDGHMAVQCLKEMQKQGVKPDSITFASLLAACSHASLISEGQEVFKIMKELHGIEPTAEHHACIVDLLARSGHLHEAEKYVVAMQSPPSSVVFKALLSACKSYGEVDLGQQYFQQLAEPTKKLVDIYANAGRLTDENEVEDTRNHARVEKKPGTAVWR